MEKLRSVRSRVGPMIAIALVAALALGAWAVSRASAQSPWGRFGSYGMMGRYGRGMGMMGGYGHGPGMMGAYGYGGTDGCGMMGDWEGAYPDDVETLTMEEALQSVERYLDGWQDEDLQIAELMEFSGNFYALVKEESTGIGAFELLVDKVSGAVSPEHGPNMMWNQKYGMMGGGYGGMMGRSTGPAATAADMPIDDEEAIERAQEYLDRVGSGSTAGDEADAFYGYYTLHVLTDGEVSGMLSINGHNGQVWYHNWHGEFVDMIGHGDELG